VRVGEAEQDALAVPVPVHWSPVHEPLPDAETEIVSLEVTILLMAATQSVTLLVLLSMNVPSQKMAPVVCVHSSMQVVFVSLSHEVYFFP
jgi:NADH:ubiquinone oxidoreductase subunit 4 (subunit M)